MITNEKNKNINPKTAEKPDRFTETIGASLWPIAAPKIMLTIGKIYRRNETLIRDSVLKQMTTQSPTLAPIGLIT